MSASVEEKEMAKTDRSYARIREGRGGIFGDVRNAGLVHEGEGSVSSLDRGWTGRRQSVGITGRVSSI